MFGNAQKQVGETKERELRAPIRNEVPVSFEERKTQRIKTDEFERLLNGGAEPGRWQARYRRTLDLGGSPKISGKGESGLLEGNNGDIEK